MLLFLFRMYNYLNVICKLFKYFKQESAATLGLYLSKMVIWGKY